MRSRIDAEREGVRVEGFAGLPTLSRANTLGQYLFVNGRPVRDKLLVGAVRGAYADYLPRDRHPLLALFVTLEAREVDVNVHPAKTEVRFRDGGLVRGLIVRALKEALAREGQRAASTGGSATIAAFRPVARCARRGSYDWRRSPARPPGLRLGAQRHRARLCGSRASRLRRRRAGRRCARRQLRAGGRIDRAPARRGARAGARDLYRGADPRRAGHRRPARRARAHRLRAHEGGDRQGRRGAADSADSRRSSNSTKPTPRGSPRAPTNWRASASSSRPSARARWRCARRRRCWARSTCRA